MALRVLVVVPASQRETLYEVHEKLLGIDVQPVEGMTFEGGLTFAHVLLALAPGAGADPVVLLRAGIALGRSIPVVWTGAGILTAPFLGTAVAADLTQALGILARFDGWVRRPWPSRASWVRSTIWARLKDEGDLRGAA